MPTPTLPKLLEGTLERVTFHNEENGYTVARLTMSGSGHLTTIVGNMHGLSPGAALRLWGQWMNHAQFGKQFVVERYEERLPATVEGLRKYLGSGLVKGVGPVTADRIVQHFGLETLTLIDTTPERLVEVPGVGAQRAELIAQAWVEQRQIKDIMVFLQGHGVSTSLAVKIFKKYGAESVAVVQADPYRLARDVYGVGFLTADKIARQLGVAADSPRRVEAGLLYVLDQLADEGHVFTPRGELVVAAATLLEVAAEQVDPAVDRLAQDEALRLDTVTEAEEAVEAVYLPPFYFAEVGVAGRITRMLERPESRLSVFQGRDWPTTLDAVDRRLPHPLALRQREAVATALSQKVCVLTGGPGTGKTTTLRAVLLLLADQGLSVALAAPTGRAAKRLGEASGVPAKTLHRLLEFKPALGGFQRDREHPLDVDMVVVDEVSMVDLILMNALTRAMDPSSHLLVVGDVDQLPSVGAGNVLRDLIGSGAVPTVRLDHIFRQAAGSYIVTNAHRVNQGQMPLFEKDSRDFFLFPVDEAEAAADRLVEVVAERIPARFGLDPVAEVQVLSPMHRGAAGVGALNERLQAALNPPAPGRPEVRLGGRQFRVGDKVMQVRNNYDKDIFNGDLGRIAAIDLEQQVLHVTFDSGDVALDYPEMDEVVHAFAISTHKSQGGEYPAVVMALVPGHYMLLQRNLLYTGITRARQLCVLVGARRAIAMAVKNDQIARRHTALAERLRGRGAGD